MRDGIVDAVRDVPRRSRTVRAVLITGEGDAFCAGMDLSASTVAQAGQARLRPAHDLRGAARRRADVHPRAVGARQADDRRGQRRRGRPGRAPRTRVRLRARAPAHPVHLVVREVGARRRRRRRVPAPPARRPAPRQGDGDARRRRDRRRRPSTSGLAYRCVDDPDVAAARGARRRRAARRGPDPLARALEAAAEPLVRDRPRELARARRRTSRRSPTTSPDLVEGMAAFREKRDAKFTGA